MLGHFRQAITTGILLYLLAAGAIAAPSAGERLRAFAHDLVESLATPATSPAQTREVFARYPDVVDQMIKSSDLEPVLKEAGLAGGELGAVGERLRDFTQKATSDQPAFKKVLIRVRRSVQSWFAPGKPIDWSRYVSESQLKDLSSQIRKMIEETKVADSPFVREMLSGATGDGAILARYIPAYLDSLPVERKAQILSAALSLPTSASQAEKMAAVFQELPPAVQKNIQTLGRELDSPAVVKARKEILSRVKPMPPEQTRKVVQRALGDRKLSDVFSEFDDVPERSGTIGQVHRARLRKTGKVVYVKVLKEGIADELRADLGRFEELSQDDPLVNEVVKKRRASWLRETEFDREAENIKKLQVYRRPDRQIGVVTLAEDVGPHGNEILVMNEVKGTPLGDLDLKSMSRVELERLGDSLSGLTETWLESAIFGDGTFHGDLHEGNIFIERLDHSPWFKVNVLDAGNVETILPAEKVAMRDLLFSCIGSRNPNEVIEVFGRFGKIDRDAKVRLLDKIRAAFQDEKLSTLGKVEAVARAAVAEKLTVPDVFVNFGAAQMHVTGALNSVNKALGVQKYGLFDIAQNVALREMLRGNPLISPGVMIKHTLNNPQELRRVPEMLPRIAKGLVKCMSDILNPAIDPDRLQKLRERRAQAAARRTEPR